MSYDAWIRGLVRNGQGFIVNGRGVTATNANLTVSPLSIFNPANSGKTIYIYSLWFMVSSTASTVSSLQLVTTDPSGTAGFTTVLTPVHLPGATNPTPVASCSMTVTGTSASISVPGTRIKEFLSTNAVSLELLTQGTEIVLAPGSGLVVAALVGTAGGYYQSTPIWVEV